MKLFDLLELKAGGDPGEKPGFNPDDPKNMMSTVQGLGFKRMGETSQSAVVFDHPFGATLRIDPNSMFTIVTSDNVVGQGKGLLTLEAKLFQLHLVKGKDGVVGGKF